MIERPRARRFPFAASIDLVDMETEVEAREQTIDLSMYGCQVASQKPWAAGARVRLRILHRGAIFAAVGRIVNVRQGSIGLAFTRIEQKEQVVLEKWLAEAREKHERVTNTK